MARAGSGEVEPYLLENLEKWQDIARATPGDAADIIEEVDHQLVGQLLSQLEPTTLAEVLAELNPQHAADLLRELSAEQRPVVLAEMGNGTAAAPLHSLSE